MNRPSFAPAALLLAFALSGCFGGAKAPPQLLTLTAASTRPAGEVRAASQGHAITVTTPAVPPEAEADRIPVYVSPTSIQYVVGAQWVAKPNLLFRQLLSDTLSARTGWAVIDPGVYTQVQGMVLSGQLLRFGVDPGRMEAVVVFEASLARPDQAVSTNRFEARVPLSAIGANEAATALNQAANQVAGQVADWAGR